MSEQTIFGLHRLPPQPHGANGPQRQPPFMATAKADAAGAATISMPTVPAGFVWVIERINISATGAAVPTLAMYDGATIASATFLDGSTTGQGDVDDRSVLVLFPGDQLTFVWAGATVAATCKCRVQYHVEAFGQ